MLVLGACDSGEAEKKAAAAAKAKADKDKAEAEKTAANIAKRKAEREAKATADAEAEEARRLELMRLCVVPDPLPKEIPSCQDVGEAHDAYVRRVGDADAVAKWDGGGKESDMPMTVVRCNQADSNKVALCQKNALDNAGPELLDHVAPMLQRCIDKFGKGGGRPGAVPAKPG